MPGNSTSWSMWPLQLLFVLVLIGAGVAFVGALPEVQSFSLTVFFVLIGAAVVIAFMLYVPRIRMATGVVTTVDVETQLKRITVAVNKLGDVPEKLNEIEKQLTDQFGEADKKLVRASTQLENIVALLKAVQAAETLAKVQERLTAIEGRFDPAGIQTELKELREAVAKVAPVGGQS